MSYRPITDIWYCVRPKRAEGSDYYGTYPAGFLERARVLLCANLTDPVLHVCGGRAHLYPYFGGYGPNDARLDLNRLVKPEYVGDVRKAEDYPTEHALLTKLLVAWRAMLADPPYSEQDATHWPAGSGAYPKPRLILRNMLSAVEPGCKVGILHYGSPRPPTDIPTRFIAKITIAMPFDNKDRTFSVYEKLDVQQLKRKRLPILKPSLF